MELACYGQPAVNAYSPYAGSGRLKAYKNQLTSGTSFCINIIYSNRGFLQKKGNAVVILEHQRNTGDLFPCRGEKAYSIKLRVPGPKLSDKAVFILPYSKFYVSKGFFCVNGP